MHGLDVVHMCVYFSLSISLYIYGGAYYVLLVSSCCDVVLVFSLQVCVLPLFYVCWLTADMCYRLHLICVHSSVCVSSQFHLVGCSHFVVVCMCVIIFQCVPVVCLSFQLLALTLSCWFMSYRSVSMFPAVLWF